MVAEHRPKTAPAADPVDASTFRRTLRWLASGVAVVTASGVGGDPCGFTATSVALVSWEPPLLLVCIDRAADCHGTFAVVPAFAIHLLRADQEDLSRRFAAKDRPKFADLAWHPGRLGAPVLEDCLAHVECRTTVRLPVGDHTILLGEAVGVALPAGNPDPLLYFRGQYARLAPPT